MALSSNNAAIKIPSNLSSAGSTFQQNMNTVNTMKMKKQMETIQNAKIRGDKYAAMKTIRKTGMQGTASAIEKQPLVRFSTAKGFSENV